jgi:hypothetical protein
MSKGENGGRRQAGKGLPSVSLEISSMEMLINCEDLPNLLIFTPLVSTIEL